MYETLIQYIRNYSTVKELLLQLALRPQNVMLILFPHILIFWIVFRNILLLLI